MTDAIREDVSSEEVVTPVEEEVRQPSPREQAMERLHERRQQELQAEVGVPEEPKEQEVAIDEPVVISGDDAQRYKLRVKIDGEEMELPAAEVVKGYQKDSAASRRLNEAAEREKALEERERQIREYEAHLKAQQKPEPPSQKDADEGDDGLGSALSALLEGDVDAATEQLRQAMKKGRATATPQINPDELRQLAEQTVDQRIAAQRFQMDYEAANTKFAEEYPEILEDQFLLQAANATYETLYREGKSIGEAMHEAGKQVRAWLNEKAGAKADAARQEKLERKKQLTTIPQANARATSTQEEEQKSASDVIAEMRKARGLA